MVTFIAVNQTISNINLVQLALTIPGSGFVNLTNYNTVFEIQSDTQLRQLVTDGYVLINDGITTLNLASSLQYLSPIASKNDLSNVAANADVTSWSNVSAALGSQAGSNDGYVFKSDGLGSGSMVKNLQSIQNRFTVGKSGDVDFITIKEAVDAAIAGGVSPTNQYCITVNSGNYTEQPMVIPNGVYIITDASQRASDVVVTAANPNADLITSNGALLSGMLFTGVTDPTKCLIRCSGGFHVFHGIAVNNCSYGVIAEYAAVVVMTNFAALISDVAIQITGAALYATGANTYLAVNGGYISVPLAVMPYYNLITTNPIQTGVYVTSGAKLSLANMVFSVLPVNNTSKAILIDNGSNATVFSCDFTGCYTAIEIGSTGANTNATIQSANFDQCIVNFNINSSTGKLYTICSVDDEKYTIIPGGEITGILQNRSTKETLLKGTIAYDYDSDKMIDISNIIRHPVHTASVNGGLITLVSGLTINVSNGNGIISRLDGYQDVYDVDWLSADLTLTANSTNYIVYDGISLNLTSKTSTPNTTDILLGTVITDSSSIRYYHNTNNKLEEFSKQIYTYLQDTRKTSLKSGLILSQGTIQTKISISSGTYYLNLTPINYSGAIDATFSYFYGTDGYTELTSQTVLNTTQYDNAGTLSLMTAGYYRSDTAILTSDGKISLILGTSQYATSALAKTASIANIPTILSYSGCYLAQIIVQERNWIRFCNRS